MVVCEYFKLLNVLQSILPLEKDNILVNILKGMSVGSAQNPTSVVTLL